MAETSGVVYGDLASPPASGRRRLLLVAAVAIVGLLNAFKPVHIDDALYLAIAKRIQTHPFDPYGFEINWQHIAQPAYSVSISPPFLSYYHAFWMALGAGDGFLLHLAMIPWLTLLAWSVSSLVGRTGPYSEWATIIILFSPGVFAGTNLMLDVPMTACLTAAVECLFRATADRSLRWMLLSGLLSAVAVLIKYPAVVFIPVCLTAMAVRRDWKPLIPAFCCAVAFVGWQWWSRVLYGAGQFEQATSFLERFHGEGGRKTAERILEQFTLIGATFPIWIVSLLHGRSRIAGLVIALIALLFGRYFLILADAWRGDPVKIYGFLIAPFLGAFSIGELLITSLRRSSGDWSIRLIALVWLVGVVGLTTIFAPFVAVRYLLPALPPILILQCLTLRPSRFSLIVTATLTTIIGGAITLADFRWSSFYPKTVAEVNAEHPTATIFFCGHWGFQWYAEKAGMTAWDARWTDAPTGALILIPQRADPTPIHPAVRGRMKLLREYMLPAAPLGVSIWKPARRNEVATCFYGWEFPHLPWSISGAPTETIGVFEVR
jgi:4-amino-4-deoxy-L-arabinose transferase-like glycosyltransferase